MSDTPSKPVHFDTVLEGLAQNPALPHEFVRRLFPHRKGMGTVAKRPDLNDGVIAEIIAIDNHWLTHSLALNRSLPPAFQMTLAEHPDPGIRAAVASRAGAATPREVYERLVDDTDIRVREYLAQNDHTPTDLLSRLAYDPDPKIRVTLAEWWTQAPEPVRRILLTDPDKTVRAAACATYFRGLPHPIPPADLVPALLADPVTRAGAVRHCTLDSATAHRLAADPDDDVRTELAEHPDLPPSLRDVLADDPSARVALGIFARENTPEPIRAAIHARIISDAPSFDWLSDADAMDDVAVERAIMHDFARMELRTLSLPWVTADPLLHVDSPYACFRISAAISGSLPTPVVARLLADEDSGVRTAMARMARDEIDQATAVHIDRTYRPVKRTRWRPADDLPLTADTLRRLATDPDPRMRQLAPRDPDLPIEHARRERPLAAATPNSVIVGRL
ncbi:hypothetical protein ACFCV9_30705 [Streptomyces sp. NPDC056367]|uniref:hypothetical protein n=1 Tax=Streptomyces sp. NPDC056367 TaxID=3345797 RepID=UPI0035DC4BFF